jgi:hypothetical protein
MVMMPRRVFALPLSLAALLALPALGLSQAGGINVTIKPTSVSPIGPAVRESTLAVFPQIDETVRPLRPPRPEHEYHVMPNEPGAKFKPENLQSNTLLTAPIRRFPPGVMRLAR